MQKFLPIISKRQPLLEWQYYNISYIYFYLLIKKYIKEVCSKAESFLIQFKYLNNIDVYQNITYIYILFKLCFRIFTSKLRFPFYSNVYRTKYNNMSLRNICGSFQRTMYCAYKYHKRYRSNYNYKYYKYLIDSI